MARKRITSRPGLFGYVYHYDEHGNRIGKSRQSLFGKGKVHFDADGRRTGTSRPGLLAKEVYHSHEDGRKISSFGSLTGDVYLENGQPVGASRPGFFDAEHIIFDSDDESESEE